MANRNIAGTRVHADLAVITVGHRQPADPLSRKWSGKRTRYIANPWASLAVSAIRPDDPVLLIGTGLTAVDVIVSLNHPNRTAPIVAVSRRGLKPQSHLRRSARAAVLAPEIVALLDGPEPLTAGRLLHQVRCWVESRKAIGIAWQQAIDGLRPITSLLWSQLNLTERKRFLRHVRPFWETHRHRIAPSIADSIEELKRNSLLEIAAGNVHSAEGDDQSVNVTLAMRDGATRTQRFAWVVNCTGPGPHSARDTHRFLIPLLEEGVLSCDDLGLGVITDEEGYALDADGATYSDLLIAGTLRKATLWEATAVPELREQAQSAARTALDTLLSPRSHEESVQVARMTKQLT